MILNPRVILIVILVFLLVVNLQDSPSNSLGSKRLLREALAKETFELGILSNTTDGDFSPPNGRWLNLTGFREEDNFAWTALENVKARAKEHLVHAIGKDDTEAFLKGQGTPEPPLYKNVSGYIRGKWVRSALEQQFQRPLLNVSQLLPHVQHPNAGEFQRNVTGVEGLVHVKLVEKLYDAAELADKVRRIRVELTVSDDISTGDGWEMTMFGVHYIDSGHISATTTSDKFAGLFGLPHLQLGESLFNTSRAQLNSTIRRTMEEQRKETLESLTPWSSQPEGSESNFARPYCDVVLYLQQHPLLDPASSLPAHLSQSLVEPLERELRFPQGHLPVQPPDMVMTMLAFSPDCGFVIESKGPPDFAPSDGRHLTGPKREVHASTSRTHVLIFACVLTAQVMLMIEQMKDASTPSTRSRISFYTIAILSLGDGLACMALLPLALVLPLGAMMLLATAVISFFALTFFDLRFMLDIWKVQSQERRRQERQRTADTTRSGGATSAAGTATDTRPTVSTMPGSLPLPVTARQAVSTGATPIILPPDQDDNGDGAAAATPMSEAAMARQELSALYVKFYLILFSTVFLSVNAASWQPSMRSLYINVFAFAYLSFWTPQIYRNVMRNCHKALLYKFTVGQSVLRLVPVVYFYAVPNNIIFARTDTTALLVLVGWVWTQLCILCFQDLFGARLFIPQTWVPPAYDYHPILREDDEDGKMPVGFTQVTEASDDTKSQSSNSQNRDRRIGKEARVFDCAICMQAVEVPVVKAATSQGTSSEVSSSSGLAGNILARRNYMVTPCRHIFHTPCLEAAMRYRLQCPICRDALPPL